MRNENTLKGYKIQVGPRWKLRINRMRLDMLFIGYVCKENSKGKWERKSQREWMCRGEVSALKRFKSLSTENKNWHKPSRKKNFKIKSCPCEIVYYCYRKKTNGTLKTLQSNCFESLENFTSYVHLWFTWIIVSNANCQATKHPQILHSVSRLST